MAFKSKKEIEELKSFVTGDALALTESGSIADLKKLDEWELADRLESINNQSLMWTWFIAMYIRDRFKSDLQMGQFINELRDKNPDHPLCKIRQQHRNRYIHAARLALRLKIFDINAIGIAPTVFYKISAPQYKAFADQLYHALKRKNYSNKEADRVIAQITALPGVKEQEAKPVDRMDYDKPALRIVQVKDNVAQEDIAPIIESERVTEKTVDDDATHYVFVSPAPPDLPEQPIARVLTSYNGIFTRAKAETQIDRRLGDADRRQSAISDDAAKQHADTYYSGSAFALEDVSADDLALELATRNGEHLTKKEITAEIMMIAERYDKSFYELADIFDECAKLARKMLV